MDAHHSLPWWDHEVIPTHAATIHKKQKTSLIVFSGAYINLSGKLHLDPEIGSAASQDLGQTGYYRSWYSSLQSASQRLL